MAQERRVAVVTGANRGIGRAIAERVVRVALPHMHSAGWGRIVNVSSRSGSFAATWATAPADGISKAGGA